LFGIGVTSLCYKKIIVWLEIKFFSFPAKQRKEAKESSPLPINLSEK
jgi:hypothetical protein